MAHIVINAMSLRPGGGLQVVAGLLARFPADHRFSVLYTDPRSRTVFNTIVGNPDHIEWIDPLGSTNNMSIFGWGMARQARWLRDNGADAVFGVNHHFPSGDVRQVIYHLNVLRFERQRGPIWSGAEIADRLRDWRTRVALEKAAANLFESRLLLDTAHRKYSNINNPEIVYIGLDDRQPIKEPSTSGSRSSTIIALTSPAPHKDNETLIRMMSVLVQRSPDVDWRLKIAGGRGKESFPNLVSLATELGVGDRIEFLGFVNHDILRDEGSRALCLVSTSRVESFCMVALEAMSWGCPPVVANTSSMPESVGNAGLLAEPGSETDFAEKVLWLFEDDNRRTNLVERGLHRARSLTWLNAANRVIDHLNVSR